MFTIEVASWIFFVCSASSVSRVNASRPHASATQMEWMPAASAIFARSIVPLKSGLPCQFTPTVSLRAILQPSLLLEVTDALVPAHQVPELVHRREIAGIEREEEERMIQRRIRHRKTAAQKEVLALKLRVDHPCMRHKLFARSGRVLAHLRRGHADQLLPVRLQLRIAGRVEQIGYYQEQDRSEERIVRPVIDNLAQAQHPVRNNAALRRPAIDPLDDIGGVPDHLPV